MLLDLPPELLTCILKWAVCARGLRRGLRLRLVCRTFDRFFQDALFATHLLDEYDATVGFGYHRYTPDLQAHQLFLSYLVGKVNSAHPDPADSPVVHIIRRVSRKYCSESALCSQKSDVYQDCIRAFCDVRVRKSCWGPSSDPYARGPPRTPKPQFLHIGNGETDKGPEYDLGGIYYLAVYFNNLTVAKRMIDLGCNPEGYWYSSGEVISLAIARSSLDVLRFLVGLSPPKVPSINHRSFWKSAQLADAETVNYLVDLYRKNGWRSLTAVQRGLPFRQLARHPDPNVFEQGRLLWEGNNTNNDGKKRRGGAWIRGEESVGSPSTDMVFTEAARVGFVDIMQHMVSLGYTVPPALAHGGWNGGMVNTPLSNAAKRFHLPVVRFLLNHNVDINLGCPLMRAAKAGSLAIARELLAHGADVHAGAERPIVHAVLLEHMSMFNLLREHGAFIPIARQSALRAAKKAGLDSMVEMLQKEEADADEPTSLAGEKEEEEEEEEKAHTGCSSSIPSADSRTET